MGEIWSLNENSFFHKILYKYMEYYCDVCDKTSKIATKIKHLQSLTHSKLSECIRKKHAIEKPDFLSQDLLQFSFI